MTRPSLRPIHLVCALGLLLAALGYRAQWDRSQLPGHLRPADLRYPVHLDGLEAASPDRLRFLAESWPPGETIVIIDAAGRAWPVVTELRQGRLALILTGMSGVLFLLATVAIFAPRGDQPGVRGFFWISLLYGLAIMIGGVYFPRDDRAWVIAFDILQVGCLAALPALFVRQALVFPRRSRLADRRPPLATVVMAAALAVFAWQTVAMLRYFAHPRPAAGDALATAHTAADVFLVAMTLLGVTLFAVRAGRLRLRRERNQVRWLLWGFAIGAAPYVLLRTLPTLLGFQPLLPDPVDRVVELAIPAAFTMAVVRHQFLDIDIIIRRSVLYAGLAAVLVAVYMGAGLVSGRVLGAPDGVDPWILPMAVGLGAGLVFGPLRRGLGRWIDRTFFKLAYDRDRVLAGLDGDLAEEAAPERLASVVRDAVAATLLPVRSAVVIDRAHRPLVAASGLGTVTSDDVAAFAAAGTAGRPAAVAGAAVPPEVATLAFPPRIARAGFVLAQPMVTDGRVAGLLLLGPRANDRHYVDADLGFLAACARIAARRLERLDLLGAVAEESLARQRLAQLDRFKSDFLNQVAHDLRTPVAGVVWSASNLRDGVVGPLTPGQLEYVASIAQSAEHLGRLVGNLLEVSRLDRPDQPLDLAPAAPHESWRRALATVAPLAAAKDVTLRTVGDGRHPPVLVDGDKMVEVAVNLLDNAVKYTAPRSTVTVTFHAPVDGQAAVSVHDRGPGLGGQSPDRLFARFAQGAPSATSSRKGFGLGLHIADTYLQRMGGGLEAADHPDGGAVFTCRVPLAARPGADLPGMEGTS